MVSGKRTAVCLALCVALCGGVFAQDDIAVRRFAIGAGGEGNMSAHKYFAGAAVLTFDVNLPRSFATGLTAVASFKGSGLTAIEAAALARRYFGPLFFAQADAGLMFYMEEPYRGGRVRTLFSGGLRAGVRLPAERNWYIEPYARGGYPYICGIGVVAGVRFPFKGQAPDFETGINR